MKTITKFLASFLIIVSSSNLILAQGGGVVAMSITPSNPTDIDQVSFIAEVWTANSGCWIGFDNTNIGPGMITIDAGYCMGLLTAICGRTDTFPLGQLTAGNYSLAFNFSSSGDCMAFANPTPSQISFTVTPTTVGIAETASGGFELFPSPSSHTATIRLTDASSGGAVKVFDALGKLVMNKILVSGDRTVTLNTTSFENGIYMVRLEQADGRAFARRLVVAR